MSTTQDSQKYLFGTDVRSSARLNYQHFLAKQQLGYLLHPSIRLEEPHRKIADIGAGTCIWSIELAQQYPEIQFDCYDVTDKQFPSKDLLLKNISLQVHNAFEDFPEHLHGTYDVVHVQMFLTIVKDDDPEPLIRNFMNLLKPGGYLYWVDVDSESVRAIPPKDPSKSASAAVAIAGLMRNPREYKAGWTSKLDTHFTNQGLLDSSLEHSVINPLFTSLHNVHIMMVMDDYVGSSLDPASDRAKALQARLAQTHSEMKDGAGILNDYVVAVGRKAS
ncbi:hypothetical protein MMC17_000295 [Xylographa soralifera]|nr:hypothetical protein [Xylographa soralifera]